jgi:16S rRNA (guanine527-N7)-methyltransferase
MSFLTLLDKLGLDIPRETVPVLEGVLDELLRWNQRRNLTAITNRDEALEKHLADSLTLLPFAQRATRLLDIGSGAGFPSLPLKIVCPGLDVVSVDAVGKKIDFQRHVVRTYALTGFVALHGRIEQLLEEPSCQPGFDLVAARALCPLGELIDLAEPFLTPGGRLVAMKGPEGPQELAEEHERLHQAGWTASVQCLRLPVSGADRCLIEVSR